MPKDLKVAEKSYSFRSARDTYRQEIGKNCEDWARGYALGVLLVLWEMQIITDAEAKEARDALNNLEHGGEL